MTLGARSVYRMAGYCPYVYDSNGMRFKMDSVVVYLTDENGVERPALLRPSGGLTARDGKLHIGIGALRRLYEKSANETPTKKPLGPRDINALAIESAKSAVRNLNSLLRAGYGTDEIRGLSREELEEVLLRVAPDGSVRLSRHLTHDGKPVVTVSSAAMAKAFMSLGYNVDLVSQDSSEAVIIENSINDLQNLLIEHAATLLLSPVDIRLDPLFSSWILKRNIDISSLSDKEIADLSREFASKFEINMCLYYKEGVNVFCGGNIGIARRNMPQLSGPVAGTDTLISRAMRSGVVGPDTHYVMRDAALDQLDDSERDRVAYLSLNPSEVLELVSQGSSEASSFLNMVDWERTGARVEQFCDEAARALGIEVEEPRFVDPVVMLASQNELQGTMVEDIADRAVRASSMLAKAMRERGEIPTTERMAEILADKHLRTEVYNVTDPKAANPDFSVLLWEETLTAGRPGTHLYMLDGHHRWAGLALANKKLADSGADYQVRLLVRNYKTDVREALEIGRAVQLAFGIKDAKVSGEDDFRQGDSTLITAQEFASSVKEMISAERITEYIATAAKNGLSPFRAVKAPAPHAIKEGHSVLDALPSVSGLRLVGGSGAGTVLAEVSIEGNRLQIDIDPHKARGRKARDSFDPTDDLARSEHEVHLLAKEQLRTLPYGRKNIKSALRRALWAVEHTIDGDVAEIVANDSLRLDLISILNDDSILDHLRKMGRSKDLVSLSRPHSADDSGF